MSNPRLDDLKQIPLFADLSASDLTIIASHMTLEEHDAGRRVISEGSAGYAFYVVERGSASVTQEGKQIRTLAAGDFFGEIAILGGGRRTATVTATTSLLVWKMFGTDFRDLESEHPTVGAALQDQMRLRLANS